LHADVAIFKTEIFSRFLTVLEKGPPIKEKESDSFQILSDNIIV
jgi:hypothetical protein